MARSDTHLNSIVNFNLKYNCKIDYSFAKLVFYPEISLILRILGLKNMGRDTEILHHLTLPHCCACPKPEPGFSTSNVVAFFVFCELRREVFDCFILRLLKI